MTEISPIVAEIRDRAGKGAARATRREGKVPGVIYGLKQTPVLIALDPRVIWAELRRPGFKTRLFDIDLGNGSKERCLARDVQFHPVSDQPRHVDFMRVSPDAVVHVKVPVHLVGADANAGVKRGGVVSLELHEIEVTCAPDLIPADIKLDISGLEIGESIHVKELALPAGVSLYHMIAGGTVVTISAPTVRGADTEASAG